MKLFQGKRILIFKAFLVILMIKNLGMRLRKVLLKRAINFWKLKKINHNLIRFYIKSLIKNLSINF